jgi:hypothetical protein
MPNAKVVQENSTIKQRRRTTQHHASKYLVIGHLDMANSDPQAKNYFELELLLRSPAEDKPGPKNGEFA